MRHGAALGNPETVGAAESKGALRANAGTSAARYLVPLCFALAVTACVAHRPFEEPGDDGSSDETPDAHGGSGGAIGSGGATGVGGKSGTGGATGGGGAAGSGGATTGGSSASGGIGAGGTTGSGGKTGSGGMTSVGGATGSGGKTGSGGMTSVGGATGSGGMTSVGGATGSGGMTSMGGAPGAGGTIVISGPCDVLAAGGNPCVAAHSTVRALYGSYTGPLYQLCKGTPGTGPSSCAAGTTLDIGVLAGGHADATSQDTFCTGATCTISIIYDQSPNGNHLKPAPAGTNKNSPDSPANATDVKITLNGISAYGVYIKTGMGYRAGCTGCGVVTAKGTATGDQPETEYMVTSQNGLVDQCCFDYGNAETDKNDDGNGTAEAVYFGGGVVWGTGAEGGHTDNTNPWVMADLENGLFAGFSTTNPSNAQRITTNTALHFSFVTAAIVGDTAAQNAGLGRFAIYGGDATAGALRTMYDGIRPTLTGYVPMKKQGSIVLGIAGDNSASSSGQFFEGVMASGAATVTTLNNLQANIVAAKYGQ